MSDFTFDRDTHTLLIQACQLRVLNCLKALNEAIRKNNTIEYIALKTKLQDARLDLRALRLTEHLTHEAIKDD